MSTVQTSPTRRPEARWDSGKPRLALTLSGVFHAILLTGFVLYQSFPKKPASAVPVFELVNVEPKLRPLAPKSPEPPPPQPVEETRTPEAPKLTSKPKNPVPVSKPEPKRVKPVVDETKPIKDVPQQSAEITTTLVANIPSDPRLSIWAGRVKKRVESMWSPPTGIDVEGQVKTVVSFQVSRDGSVATVGVSQTSGNVLLDQLAERTILRLEHLPPIPENYPEDVIQVSYEFIYHGQ